MTTSTIKFESYDKDCFASLKTEVKTSYFLFQNTIILGRPRITDFAEIDKIATMVIEKSF